MERLAGNGNVCQMNLSPRRHIRSKETIPLLLTSIVPAEKRPGCANVLPFNNASPVRTKDARVGGTITDAEIRTKEL